MCSKRINDNYNSNCSKGYERSEFAKGTIECNLSFYSAEALIVKRLPRQSAGFVKNEAPTHHCPGSLVFNYGGRFVGCTWQPRARCHRRCGTDACSGSPNCCKAGPCR